MHFSQIKQDLQLVEKCAFYFQSPYKLLQIMNEPTIDGTAFDRRYILGRDHCFEGFMSL